MKIRLQHISVLFLVLFFIQKTDAQDLHFSQYFNAPLLTNPANTGFIPDHDYRIGVNYRNQWARLTNNPYKTMSAWGDVKLFNKSIENGWVGLGFTLLNDVAGEGNLSSLKIYTNLAYHQLISDNILISGGFGLGFVQKKVDYTKLTFDNQWNGNFFDIKLNSAEPFSTNAVNYLDLNAGLNISWFASDNLYLNGGFSLMHINQPNESFYSTNTTDTHLDKRLNFFLNANIKLNDRWILNPNMYGSKLASAWETTFGLTANRNISGDGKSQLILGVYYRNSDAAIPVIGYQIGNLKLTFNYDATVSSLSNFNNGNGAYEFSIVQHGLFGGGDKSLQKLKCNAPRF